MSNKKEQTDNLARQAEAIITEPLAVDETYTCTMHNEVTSDHPGECPKCGMKLVKQKMTPEQKKMMKEDNYTKPKD